MTRALKNGRLAETEPERTTELLHMLTYMRPANSNAEEAFIRTYLLPLGCQPDEYGNHWLTIGRSPILWSSHTDTVHKHSGRQAILFGDGIASIGKGNANCLGADCTVGVWLMVNMIRCHIPGTYVFHCEEEIGGCGSRYIADETPERLAGLQYAIAFDRKGHEEIITHQMGERCCSVAFARSLGGVLLPMAFRASDGGTFTDTANYAEIIPECTNLAVGYHNQHQNNEWLDVEHATRLLDTLLLARWDDLVCERDPSVSEDWSRYAWSNDRRGGRGDQLALFCAEYPEEVAAFLRDRGFDQGDIEDHAWSGMGFDQRLD